MTVSANGGYDDNAFTTESDKDGGFTVGGGVGLLVNLPMKQTFVGMRYNYGANYGDVKQDVDQSHTADLIYAHTFNPRLNLSITERFRAGIEPELVEQISGVPIVTRQRGDYFYNSISSTLTYSLSRRWSLSLGGGWERWMFDEESVALVNDRDSYSASVGANYSLSPRTFVGGNYRYGSTFYEDPSADGDRDTESHSLFANFSHRFTPKLGLSLDAGASMATFADGTQDPTPLFALSLGYSLTPQSSMNFGFNYSFSLTEVAQYQSSDVATIFLSANHRFGRKVSVNGSIAYSRSTYDNPGPLAPPTTPTGLKEETFRFGLAANYDFTKWVSVNLAFTHEEVLSDLSGRSYDRNRVSMGMRFAY